MPNVLNLYDPLFYANEALIILYKRLGMAQAVYRGYEPNPQQKGSTIQINKPSTFTASAMPNSATDLVPGNVPIVLNQWFGVTFKLTDKELTYTKEKIITDHVDPAAFAVADKIDDTLCALYRDVPWFFDAAGTAVVADLTGTRKVMFDNKVPLNERYLMINGEREAGLLGIDAFIRALDSSDGAATQRDGYLGKKFGFNIWANQNVYTHATTAITITTGPLNAAAAAVGATSVTLAATAVTGTIKAGDTFSVVGVTQRFAVTADATFSGNSVTVQISSPVKVALPGATLATVRQQNKAENLAFHKNAFALAMAPLSELGDGLGARIATAIDPVTGLALRSRVWYQGGTAELYVSIDALWGVKTLDPDLAVRMNS